MGKMIYFLTILIFADLLFLTTGQLSGTLTSTLFNIIVDLSNAQFSDFFTILVGNFGTLFSSGNGIASFLTTVAVTTGFIFSPTDTKLFVPMALAFGLLFTDLIGIFVILKDYSLILATFIMAPLAIIYIVTVVEWLGKKD